MKPYRPAQPGAANHQAKLNEHEAREVREARRRGTSRAELARAYQISLPHVSRLARGSRWIEDLL